ncbi:hypothetical protein SPRG_02253 [Saprolegnia parasitica CBS 223.65]|uniref:Uncharacterized protein n=1 Tax=Saprolegnia parasitica (strain CBS 223.65) TaxID=695850 RepID=A0A067D3W5_SAPPC|nr:hypothetical protein SPRG_02253 [Saprolegnia parasitica CBS 223.65]KDO33446.1 hypothetical protein SPRG_02253 [Saprolegnia parasitica CBS 223.65]|eukprot:XP_012196192.1 hypothetical protein SPRG_02253 [Saprolegnia parasitica CBS 223.65]
MTDDETHLALLTVLGAGACAVAYLHTKALLSAAEVPLEEEARRTERLVRIRNQATTLQNAYAAAVAQHSRLDKLMSDYEAARLASMQGLRLAAKRAIDEVAIALNSSCHDYLDQQRAVARRLPPYEPAPETLVLRELPRAPAPPPQRPWEHGGVVLLIVMVCCGIMVYASKRRRAYGATIQTTPIAHVTHRQSVRLVATRNDDDEDDGHASTWRVP